MGPVFAIKHSYVAMALYTPLKLGEQPLYIVVLIIIIQIQHVTTIISRKT